MKFNISILVAALLGVCATVPAVADALVAQEYPVEAVNEISAGGGGEVEITQGDTESLRVEAAPDVMKRVKVDLTNHKLSLGVKDINGNFFHWFDRNNDKVKFILQVKKINKLEFIGAAQGRVGNYHGDKLLVKNSGAAQLSFAELSVGELTIDSSGAANATIQTLNSQKVVIDLSGASNLEIKKSGAVQQMKLGASGASNYRGKPLFVANAEAEASGASNIDIQVSETLHAVASGASNINYYGSAKATFNASGASHVNGYQ